MPPPALPKMFSGPHHALAALPRLKSLCLDLRRAIRPPSRLVAASVTSSAAEAGEAGPGELERRVAELCQNLSNLFPLWVLLGAASALFKPEWFTWFCGDWIIWGLAVTMIGMGTSLEAKDFARLGRTPWLILLGVMLQYTIMPLLGAIFGHLAGLPKPFAVGLVLVACCPGGTASNVVTFLAKADVPLSVGMTTASTLLAVLATPWLTSAIVGTMVPVNVMGLLVSTCQVVLLPVAIGSLLNRFFPKAVARTRPFSPLVAILTVALICASVVAANASILKTCGLHLVACVFGLHAGGFALGYLVPRLLGIPEKQARTMSIEVGMQNSTLGSMLATLHFASLAGAAAPGAISACMHSIIGSAAAAFWRSQDTSGQESQMEQSAPSLSGADGSSSSVREWVAAWRAKQATGGHGVPPPPLPAKQEVPKAPPPVTESSESDMAVPLMSNIASVFPTKEEAGAGLEEAKSIVTGSFVEDVRSIDMNMEMTVDVFTSSVEEALKQIKAPPSQPSPRDANKNRNK